MSRPSRPPVREGVIALQGARLHSREVGSGPPVLVLHGGPDFDHHYLLPELDQLADSFRLIYYDQRGRGRSSGEVKPEDVTIESEVADLDWVREHFALDTVSLLGHSWGALLALEYAAAHPDRVTRLILLNPAPATHEDLVRFRTQREASDPERLAAMRQIAASPAYKDGDPEAEARYYRLHFEPAIRGEENLENIVGRLRTHFTPADIVKARAIEDRLYDQTWRRPDYDVLARVAAKGQLPTRIVHGDRDLIPVECALGIGAALPWARLTILRDCGHFSYLERPAEVRAAILEE